MNIKPSSELLAASDEVIREKLKYADPMILRTVLYYTTRDESMRTEVAIGKQQRGAWTFAVTDEAGAAFIRAKAADLLIRFRDGQLPIAKDNSEALLKSSMELLTAIDVSAAEVPFWAEELALDPMVRRLKWKDGLPGKKLRNFKIAIIGCGVGGINSAVQLKQAGFHFEIFEKNSGVGGVWFQNRYPGARVDTPSRMYSNTFAVNYQFESPFAPQRENEAYMNWCVDSHGLRDRIHFNSEVLSAEWEESSQQWKLTIRRDGILETTHVNAVISAVGFLDRPLIPEIAGAEEFAGVQLHSVEFDWSLDWSTKKVGLIGTGCTGMQLAPEIAPMVAHLEVFQRTPAWVMPIPGYREKYPADYLWCERNIPFYANWSRFAVCWALGEHAGLLRFLVKDPDWHEPGTMNAAHQAFQNYLLANLKERTEGRPDLFDKLLPSYPPLAKRLVIDNGWFDMLRSDNVALNTDGVARFAKDGVITTKGDLVPLDVVIYATGFRASDYLWPMRIVGRDGMTLEHIWSRDGARAYWGVSIPQLPNFFCIYGPNTNPSSTGPVQWGEMQIRYIMQVFEHMLTEGYSSVELKAESFDSFNAVLDERMNQTLWMKSNVASYVINDYGRSATNAPWTTFEYWSALRVASMDDYHVVRGEVGVHLDERVTET